MLGPWGIAAISCRFGASVGGRGADAKGFPAEPGDMDGQALEARVRAETETELARLASDRALLAATDATLEAEAVLSVVTDALASGEWRLEEWAGAAEDPALADAMAAGADRLAALRADHRDVLPAEPTVEAPVPLGEPGDDLARAAAGLLGLPLALDPLCLQAVSFFVNEADEATADAVREIRSGVGELRADGLPVLADRASAAAAEEEVVAAAGAVIEAAYADYADSLEAMGLDPRPIC